MNKPSKSKSEYKSRNSHSTAIVTIIDETPKTFVLRYDDGSTLRCHKDHFERDWQPSTDIITRMEAAQQRFNPFPSLLISAENERRLQLKDRADWVQDGDPPAFAGESEAEYNQRTGRYE